MQVNEVIKPFLTYCKAERLNRPETQSKYEDCLKCWIVTLLGDHDLEGLTRLDILTLRDAMVSKELSVSRQYSVLMTLKLLLKFCRLVLKVNCLDPAEVKLPHRPRPYVSFLDNQEIQKVLDAINITSLTGARLRALIELLLATGMRISEALSLPRHPFDVGLSEAEIVGKGNKPRTVFFSARCKHWIQNYLNKRFDDHPALFVTTGYPPSQLARADISRFFVNLRRQAGIQKRLTPHLLRHTFCTNLLFNGADIAFIKELVGHQNIQTTARYYLGVDKTALRQVMDKCLDYGFGKENDKAVAAA
jgi:integrase/recombinase XerD